MRKLANLIVAVVGVLWVLGLSGGALADLSVCDTTILNRPGCEVGDFGGIGGSGANQSGANQSGAHATVESLLLSIEFYRKNNNYETAIKLGIKALGMDPSNPEILSELYSAHLQYGDALKVEQDFDGAFREYQKARTICKNDKKGSPRLKEIDQRLKELAKIKRTGEAGKTERGRESKI